MTNAWKLEVLVMSSKVKNSTVSKDVGWDKRNMPIPSRANADAIIGAAKRGRYGAIYTLLEWHRFCPTPETDEGRKILEDAWKAYQEVTE